MKSDALRNREEGARQEYRFYRLLSEYSKSQDALVVGTMRANPEDNQKGIDFYVIWKDDATIPVDVKSSYSGKKKRLSKSYMKDACIIFMRDDFDDERMLSQILEVLKKWKGTRLF